MLCVRLLSGEEVASVPLEELSDVKALKQQLHRLHCLPARFSQRLSLSGNLLDDTAKLDSPMELELVLLPYAATSQTQVDEFTTASAAGSVSQVPEPISVKTFSATPSKPLKSWSTPQQA